MLKRLDMRMLSLPRSVLFGITFPETIFKMSNDTQDGLVFTAPLSTSEIFKGGPENSAKARGVGRIGI